VADWISANNEGGIEWRVEDSGYLTCIDLTKKENVEMEEKQ